MSEGQVRVAICYRRECRFEVEVREDEEGTFYAKHSNITGDRCRAAYRPVPAGTKIYEVPE